MWFDVSLPVAGIVSAFPGSAFAVQAIVAILFVGSILVWSMVVTRYAELSQTEIATKVFLEAYRKETHPVSLFVRREKHEATPLYAVYDRTCGALAASLELTGLDPTSDLFMRDITAANRKLDWRQIETVTTAADNAREEQCRSLRANLRLLAFAAVMALVAGLTGMVLDGLDVLQTTVAGGDSPPGAMAEWIAGPLLPSVMGLLVALPAGIGYRLLKRKIARICAAMEDFSRELLSGIGRHYLPDRSVGTAT